MEINSLPNGREIFALKGTFTQPMTFGLRGKLPEHENIMSLRQFDEAMNRSGAARSLPDRGGWWRICEYGVYSRGLESGKPIGVEAVWVEDGYRYVFEVPDVRNPSDRNIGLRESTGMLVFALDKLRYNRLKRSVSVAADFDPEKDVRVKDICTDGWALADEAGYPLRSRPSAITIEEARAFRFIRSPGFEHGSSGWHGSIALLYGETLEHGRRTVDATNCWRYPSGVAAIRSE